jgi:hypothetical protein
VGPDYDKSQELKHLGWIIGQHHAHLIPKGLPGEGHILVFDNGGFAGYGAPNAVSPTGIKCVRRDYSRVLEYDPITLKIVWQYQYEDQDRPMPINAYRFYSSFESSAQRLPNGNTLIAESAGGRILEVTAECDIVWEYVNPFWSQFMNMNKIYRAYRLPYEWVPQLDPPEELPIEPVDLKDFRLPGAAASGFKEETVVEGVLPFPTRPDVRVDDSK